MPDDARRRVLFICQHGAAAGTGRIGTVMAGGCDDLLEWSAIERAQKRSGVTPRFPLIQSVQTVTCRHAGFAAGALVEVHLEGILLAGRGCAERDQPLVISFGLRRGISRPALMPAGKAGDRSIKPCLVRKQLVD